MSEMNLTEEELATLRKVIQHADQQKCDSMEISKPKKMRSQNHLWAAVAQMTEELKTLYVWYHRNQAELLDPKFDQNIPHAMSDRMNAIQTLVKLQTELDRLIFISELWATMHPPVREE